MEKRGDKDIVRTDIINATRGIYIKELLSHWIIKNLWCLTIPLILFIAAGFSNNAFFYLAAIWVCIIYPLGLMAVYLNYALNKDLSFLCLFPYSVVIDSKCVTVNFNDIRKTDEEGNVVTEHQAPASFRLPVNEIKNKYIYNKFLLLSKRHHKSLIIIPLQSFKSSSDIQQAEKILQI